MKRSLNWPKVEPFLFLIPGYYLISTSGSKVVNTNSNNVKTWIKKWILINVKVCVYSLKAKHLTRKINILRINWNKPALSNTWYTRTYLKWEPENSD